MDESVRESLNFLLVGVISLAVLGLFSSFVLPSWLHAHPLFVVGTVVVGLVAAHRLVYSGTIAELGLSPLPPESDDAPDAAPPQPERAGKTPKERIESREE
ncbi:hypothetical protein JCM30237_22760 [Halolamina litorea]|uniref:Uncharacterized protein n=1 Tax=Halolamina litorea TaxID=1515593 RepID=A0ABD6BRJ1_9EURY|nr:hypothetical protein [Halolamina litorea]